MRTILRGMLCSIIVSVAVVAQGAEYELRPSIAVSEEFTDNLFNTSANRISDYISHATPGLAANYKAPALNGDLTYLFDYRWYARHNRDDEIAHSLSAKSRLTAVDNLLFLEVGEEYQRVSLNATRDVSKESLFINQSDRNVVFASPYVTFRPTDRLAVKSGYRFTDTRYFNSSGVDKTDHNAFLAVAYELTKRWSLTADYTFVRELAAVDNFNQHLVLGGFRYEYSDKSYAFAQAGKAWIDYDRGYGLNTIVWNAGVTHEFQTATATLATGVKYNEDPSGNVLQESFVSGRFEKRFSRGSLVLSPSYSEYVKTETDSLQTKKYGVTAQGQYEILSGLNGKLAVTTEKYEQHDQPLRSSHTNRIQIDSGLSYLLAREMTAALSYVYVDYSSPGVATDNWHVNRVTLEIKKTF